MAKPNKTPKSDTPKAEKKADGPRYKVDLKIENTPFEMRLQTFRSPKTGNFSSRAIIFPKGPGKDKPRKTGSSIDHGKGEGAFAAAKARVEKLVEEAIEGGWSVTKVGRPKRVDEFNKIPSVAEILAEASPDDLAEDEDEDYQGDADDEGGEEEES